MTCRVRHDWTPTHLAICGAPLGLSVELHGGRLATCCHACSGEQGVTRLGDCTFSDMCTPCFVPGHAGCRWDGLCLSSRGVARVKAGPT
eukprot:9930281-Alexandrium_andersonii.AAC.1